MERNTSLHAKPKTGPEIRENNRKNLRAFILLIKDRGVKIGVNITEEEIARELDIPAQRLLGYLHGEESTPDNLPGTLLSTYKGVLDAGRKKENGISLKRAVVWIRNCGLAEGLNITVGEMAQKMGIPEEQLYNCLNDEHDTPDDYVPKLVSPYKHLTKEIKQIEIVEDIERIKKR